MTDTSDNAKAADTLGVEDSALLVTLRGRAIGERILLKPGDEKVVIGRDDDADLTLPDDSASRLHCELKFGQTGWFISDLSSTNGTYVGGQLTDSALLRDGDIIKIGATIFRFLSSQDVEQPISGNLLLDHHRWPDSTVQSQISRRLSGARDECCRRQADP